MHKKILLTLFLGLGSVIYAADLVNFLEVTTSHPLLEQTILSNDPAKTELVEKLVSIPEEYTLFTVGKMQDGQHIFVCKLQKDYEELAAIGGALPRTEFAMFKGQLGELKELKIWHNRKRCDSFSRFISGCSGNPVQEEAIDEAIRKGIAHAQEGELRMLVRLGVEDWSSTAKVLSLLRIHNKGTVGTYSSQAFSIETIEKQCLQFSANAWFKDLQKKEEESSDCKNDACDDKIPQADWVEWYI